MSTFFTSCVLIELKGMNITMAENYTYITLQEKQQEDLRLIDGCNRYGLYFIYTITMPDIEDVYKRFIGNLGYIMVQEESNRIVSLLPYDAFYFMEDYYIDKMIFSKNLDDALTFIEKNLAKGMYLSLRTIQEKVPFLRWYDETFCLESVDNEKYDKYHRFLLIGYDDVYYYFIDNIDNIKQEHCMIYTEDGVVRKAKRETMYAALGQLSDIRVYNIDTKRFKENLSNIPLIVQRILKDSVDIYYSAQQNEKKEYKGRTCWVRLMEMCDLGNVSLLGSNPNENPRLIIGLVNIIKRRQLLLKTIRNTTDLCDSYNTLIISLEHDISALVEVKNVLLKQVIKGQKYMNVYVKRLLEKILCAEDDLHMALLTCLEK